MTVLQGVAGVAVVVGVVGAGKNYGQKEAAKRYDDRHRRIGESFQKISRSK
jgi:hypothetical protein